MSLILIAMLVIFVVFSLVGCVSFANPIMISIVVNQRWEKWCRWHRKSMHIKNGLCTASCFCATTDLANACICWRWPANFAQAFISCVALAPRVRDLPISQWSQTLAAGSFGPLASSSFTCTAAADSLLCHWPLSKKQFSMEWWTCCMPLCWSNLESEFCNSFFLGESTGMLFA